MQPILDNFMDEGSSFIATFYQRYSPALFAYLYRQTPTREDAEDILLEVFVAALEHKAFSTWPERSQVAWIWRVARNKIADSYRRSTRHPHVPMTYVDEMFFEEKHAPDPEQVALEREENGRLHAAVQHLPPLQRDVLRLRFEHGLSHSEIAQVLQKKVGSVRVLLSRTLKQLRGIYTKA